MVRGILPETPGAEEAGGEGREPCACDWPDVKYVGIGDNTQHHHWRWSCRRRRHRTLQGRLGRR
eukprot:2486630-Prorocentrum_lima.AAC.1